VTTTGADGQIGHSIDHKPNPSDNRADSERRFGALRRLYGDPGYARLRAGCVAVVGLGGVGSWTAEALARSGVARLVLIDMDHIAESNINRQVQATSHTLGQHKGGALRARIQDIHPDCEVVVIDDFVSAENWPQLLVRPLAGLSAGLSAAPSALLSPAVTSSSAAASTPTACNHNIAAQVVVDACDQIRAKATLARWALQTGVPLVCVGAAGGKQQAQWVDVQDMADTSHDPLLASLRQRLRKEGVAPQAGGGRIGVRCVFSKEAVMAPKALTRVAVGDGGMSNDGTLNCHGYGSSVTVTATFGMVAAGEAIAQLLALSTPDLA
jgi:tRNA threonylcarbamoyladenosine dehydratase